LRELEIVLLLDWPMSKLSYVSKLLFHLTSWDTRAAALSSQTEWNMGYESDHEQAAEHLVKQQMAIQCN